MKCRMCEGNRTIHVNDGNDEIDCPVCDGDGEWDGPHVCGVRIKLVETTENPLGDPVGWGDLVFMWRHTAEQILKMYGPETLARLGAGNLGDVLEGQ